MPAIFSIGELETRINKLERDACFYKRISLASTLALVALTAIGAAAVSGTTTSKPLTILDGSGHARVRLDASGLHLLDTKGHERLTVGFNSVQEPAIHLADSRGLVRFRMYIGPDSQPGLKFEDARNKDRMILGFSTGKSPQLRFYDGAENDRLMVGMSDEANAANSSALLRMYNAPGKFLVSLEGQSKPFMRLSDNNGVERTVIGLSTENDPLLQMFGSDHSYRIELQGGDGPFLRLRDGSSERVYLGLSTSGDPQLQVFDTSHTERGFMGIYTDKTAGAYFKDSSGSTTWQSP